ncbi:undecaprenyl-phosphate alpha-N-acetylglucosaminyl 1-phosphate transferase [Endozoicomonas sp.]|nr:undecaprenyl-phosphate alpha-N-acetylglucosaminyl 1-phosphate transferase [Endozoicomonas sp.]
MEKALFFKALFAFVISFALIKILKPISIKVGLVDKPNERKQHDNEIPLVGGLGIYLAVLAVGLIFVADTSMLYAYYSGAGLLTVVGVIDDRINLSVKIRIMATFIATGIMIYYNNVLFINLGNLLGFGDIRLPFYLAVPFTMIATFGIVNAMNMMDGIDGLSSSLTIVTLAALLVVLDFHTRLKLLIIVLIAALLAFQIFNLELSRRVKKVFMGDAGSMMVGFTLIMFICFLSQSTALRGPRFEPVTGLFFVGLPLIDMVSTVLRRIKKGKSPFHPDRTHAHHILMHAGFSPRQTLVILIALSALINSMGLLLEYLITPAWLQFIVFLLLFVFYFQGIQHSFKLSHFLQKVHGQRISSSS